MVTTRGVVAQMLTSDMGQSRRFSSPSMTSGFPPEADTVTDGRHVSKGPTAVMARIPSWKRRSQKRVPPMLRERGDNPSK